MCGICGIINTENKPVEESSIRKMLKIMKHRGPDDEGVFLENGIGLGFVRLSIIDLTSAGHQPKLSFDERYVLVFNGEIYNYIELREELIKEGFRFYTRTDSEVLLNGYIKWGSECMHHFNGMFSFAVYDRVERKTFCARDRFGIKPFYYLLTDQIFAFCSEIPPLLSLLGSKPKPDYQSIFDYLVFNRTDQTHRTFFYEINKLQHGCEITTERDRMTNQITFRKWYDLRERVKKSEGFRDPAEFKELFTSAVGLRLRSDVPVGVCLSGGIDSSSIVSVLLKDFLQKGLNTFSAIYQKGQRGDETEFINEYKKDLANMYFVTPDSDSLAADLLQFVKAHAEPIPSTSPYAQYKVMNLAKGKVVVTLDGQGADEMLAGYLYFFGFYFKHLLTHGQVLKLSSELYQYITKHNSLIGIKSFLFFILPKKLRTRVRINEKGYLNSDFINYFKNTNSVSGNIYGSKNLSDALIDHFEYKLEHLLKWEDRNSMWFSLESRVPFLDYRLVEKTLSSSSDLKIRKGMTKYLLREAMKGIVPEKIRLRKDKIGFATPQDEWFRQASWQKKINDIFNSESFSERNLINIDVAKKQYVKHLQGRTNISNEIWKWINLELWFREFID